MFLTLDGKKLSHDQAILKQDKAEKETNETDFVVPTRKPKRQSRNIRMAQSLNINVASVTLL